MASKGGAYDRTRLLLLRRGHLNLSDVELASLSVATILAACVMSCDSIAENDNVSTVVCAPVYTEDLG